MNAFFASLLTAMMVVMPVKIHGALDVCTSRLERGAVMCQIDIGTVFTLHNINASMCTHILVLAKENAFANGTLDIKDAGSFFAKDPDLMAHFKAQNIHVGIVIGGHEEGHFQHFPLMAEDPESRTIFVDNLLSFMKKYGLNVVEISLFTTSRIVPDLPIFETLIEEVSRVIRARGWQIGVTIDGSPHVFFSDPVGIAKHVDYLNVVGHSYYRQWSDHVWPNAPIKSANPTDKYTVKYSLELLLGKVGVNCLVLTIPMFGVRWVTLNTAIEPGPGSFVDAGYDDVHSTYTEICDLNFRGGCRKFNQWDNFTRTPWGICGNADFVTYDNPKSIREKVDLALEMGIKGVSAFTINGDDYQNTCGGGKYPLLRAAQKMRTASQN